MTTEPAFTITLKSSIQISETIDIVKYFKECVKRDDYFRRAEEFAGQGFAPYEYPAAYLAEMLFEDGGGYWGIGASASVRLLAEPEFDYESVKRAGNSGRSSWSEEDYEELAELVPWITGEEVDESWRPGPNDVELPL